MTHLALSSDAIEANLSGIAFRVDTIPFFRSAILRHEILDGSYSSPLLSYHIIICFRLVNGHVQPDTGKSSSESH